MYDFAFTTLLGLLLLDGGCRLTAGVTAGCPTSARLLAGVVLGASQLLLLLLALGAGGAIAAVPVLSGVLGLWLLAARFGGPGILFQAMRRASVLLGPRRAPLSRTLAAWILVAACGYALLAGLAAPTPSYDAMSYHLPFTAAVLDQGVVPLLDTPFGDPAQAYQPKNDSLLRAVFALAAGDERLIWCGAWFHLPLLLLSVHATARALGCSRGAALWGAACVLLAPVVLQQARGAMVDLPFASWWMAGTALTVQRPRRRGAGLPLVAGLGWGLAYGTKFLAVPFTPLLLAVAPLGLHLHAGHRLRSLGHLGLGLCLTGSFFYLRNAFATGNPIYPISVTPLGVTLLTGEYGREAMLPWIYNLSGATLQPLRELAFLYPLTGSSLGLWHLDLRAALVVPALLWLVGALASLRRPRVLAVLLLTPAVLALCWWVVPFTYGRFAILSMAGVGVAAARGAGFLGAGLRGVGRAVPWLLLLQLLLCRRVDLAPIVLAAGLGLLGARALGRPRRAWLATLLPVGLLGAAFVLLARPFRPPWTGMALPFEPPIAAAYQAGWRKLAELPEPGNLAYAGNNLPYPLRGPARRKVLHIPIDGRRDLHFHDRARAWRQARLPRPICPEPGLDRRRQDARAWLEALRRRGITYLVVTRMNGPQLLQIRHDAQGFPVEAAWAAAATPALELVWEQAGFRIWHLRRGRRPAAKLPGPVLRREPDAFSLLGQPTRLAELYPLGAKEILAPKYARMRARAGY